MRKKGVVNSKSRFVLLFQIQKTYLSSNHIQIFIRKLILFRCFGLAQTFIFSKCISDSSDGVIPVDTQNIKSIKVHRCLSVLSVT